MVGILFVLKSGINWEVLPVEMGCGCGMTCWLRLDEWTQASVWTKLHELLLVDLEYAGKIDWFSAAIDSSHARARGRDERIGVRRAAGTTSKSSRRFATVGLSYYALGFTDLADGVCHNAAIVRCPRLFPIPRLVGGIKGLEHRSRARRHRQDRRGVAHPGRSQIDGVQPGVPRRGRRGTQSSPVAGSNWRGVLQWGHGEVAVENDSPTIGGRPPRRRFNGTKKRNSVDPQRSPRTKGRPRAAGTANRRVAETRTTTAAR